MKRNAIFAFLLLLCAGALIAQSSHKATLTWTPSVDDTTAQCAAPNTCSQSVYRAAGACPQTFGAAYATGVSSSASTYVDTAPLIGNSCYAVTFLINGVESKDSNLAGGSLQPAAQTNLAVSEN